MQHWTFAEVINSLKIQNLHLITTHSMAPWTIPEKQDPEQQCRRVFRAARQRLAGLDDPSVDDPSVYENAWRPLTVDSGLPYPSTAAFATRLWPAKKISIALCEFNFNTAEEIDGWLSIEEIENHFSNNILFRGDWRKSIQSPQIWNSQACCTYIEMDPMRYDTRPSSQRRSTSPDSLYPEDLELIVDEVKSRNENVVLQISSFSTQNNMSLDSQRDSMINILAAGDFKLEGETRVGGQMGSFLFTRGLELQVGNLKQRFDTWLQVVNADP